MQLESCFGAGSVFTTTSSEVRITVTPLLKFPLVTVAA